MGYILRTRIADPPEHRRTHDAAATPFRDVIHKHPREALASGALITLSTICTYALLVYTPVYAVRILHLPQATGLGLSDNIAVSVFGGTAALVITWLIALTGSNLIPAFYLMAGGVVGLLGTLPLRR